MNAQVTPDKERYHLLFSVRRSIRYHDRRCAFFENWHRLTSFTTVLLSGAVLMEMSGSHLPLYFKVIAILGAILGALDLIIGFSRNADRHRNLKRRFVKVEQAIESNESPASIRNMRLEIEADEPPVFCALDLLCHNELCAAEGYSRSDECSPYVEVGLFKTLTANFIKWKNVGHAATR